MKVIFLDFDGVITIPDTKWNISLEHIKRVKYICDKNRLLRPIKGSLDLVLNLFANYRVLI